VSLVVTRGDSKAPVDYAQKLAQKNLVIRCIIYPHKKEYTAECIDLDLMARGRTPHEAFMSLKSAVVGYLKVVLDGDPQGLVPRPSPVLHRLRYHACAFCAALIGPKRKFLIHDCTPETLLCSAKY
jgi:hypothetical protein